MPKSGIAVSYVHCLCFLWLYLDPVVHSGCTNLHTHPHCGGGGDSSPHPLQYFLFVDLLINDGHSDRCEVAPRRSLDLHFSLNE